MCNLSLCTSFQPFGSFLSLVSCCPDVRVCMSAWLGVIYTVDDLLERMTPSEAEAAIEISVAALHGKERVEENFKSKNLRRV